MILVNKIELTAHTKAVKLGESISDVKHTTFPNNADNPCVKWFSSNPGIAAVNEETGLVIGNSVGNAIIYAKACDGSGTVASYYLSVGCEQKTGKEETKANSASANIVQDPIDLSTGAHIMKNTLMSLFGGQGLKLIAQYASNKLEEGALGIGWYHNFEKRVVILEDTTPNDNINQNAIIVYSNPSTYTTYTLFSDYESTYKCTMPGKKNTVLRVNAASEFPCIIEYYGKDTEYYNANGSLAKIVNHQGFETVIEYIDNLIIVTDTLTSKKFFMEKNEEGKIVRVYDDVNREVILAYTNNYLTAITDVNGNTLTFTYDQKGRIISGTDAHGVCYFTDSYDDSGRVEVQKDAIATSRVSEFTYDGNVHTVTDRNGKVQANEYDSNGLLVKTTNANGHIKTYAYDSEFNMISETDENGNERRIEYNAYGQPIKITDKNGNETEITYDTNGNVTNIQYPAVNGVVPEERFIYNLRNQVIKHTNIRGTTTTYTYDDNGLPATRKVGDKSPEKYVYSNGFLATKIDSLGNVTRYTYNLIGQMARVKDANGNETKYEYDNMGNLLHMTDANDRIIDYEYDKNYQKVFVSDFKGNETTYSYNGNMKNTAVHFADDTSISYEYDGEDRLVKIIDQAGNIVMNEYDNVGRIISKTLQDGSITRYEYNAIGNVIKETNSKGSSTIKTYDPMGNVLTVMDGAGNVTKYEYNSQSKVIKVENAVGGITTFAYSVAGDLLSETDALGNKKEYTYDSFGNRLTFKDAKGNITRYTYDANNNMTSLVNALGETTEYVYNALNQLVEVKDAKNNVIRYGYDALGRRTTITDAKNNVFTTFYDSNGNVIKTTDAKGNIISEKTYDSMNRPATVVDSTGKTTYYTYNAIGKIASITDPTNRVTEFEYGLRGENIAVVDALNGRSSATYDSLGNKLQIAGPRGGVTNYTYDNMGRLTSESTVSGGEINYSYNALNLKSELTNARGQSKQFTYDAKGRIVECNTPEGLIAYTYDANDNVLTVTDANGTVTREYDALNRMTKLTDTFSNVIQYEYDEVGNLSSLVYPDNSVVTYEYDVNHNLIKVTDWSNRVTTYTYDENNRVVSISKPDGSITTTTYDNKQRIVSTVAKTPADEVIFGFEYEYDDLGRVVEEKVLAYSTKMCYTYDSLDRVIKREIRSLDNDLISEENFEYDAAGNIVGDSSDTSLAYDFNNRLIEFANASTYDDTEGTIVHYDADGNMLSYGSNSFTYDSSNRLISANEHTYTYTASNVRIKDLCEDKETIYTYNTNCKLSKLLTKTTNNVVTKYVYGRGLIGEEVNAAFKTYHFDFRGSTIAITDESCIVRDTFVYDTYGKIISRTGSDDVIFAYNGRDGVITEPNGLVYMRARYYSPTLKRFINADILEGDISNAITINRFAYANGNPVSNVDPLGLSADSRDTGVNTDINYIQAVLVSRTDDAGLKVVGHTQLYFLGDDGKWYCTEFTTSGGDSLKEMKGNASIYWYVKTPPVYDVTSRTFKDVAGSNYVVLNGNFNECVKRVDKYLSGEYDFGKYNFLFNNCSDYTDEILDVADVDGLFSQIMIGGDSIISVPAIRELETSLWKYIDSGIEYISSGLMKSGEYMGGDSTFIGQTLITVGDFIDRGTNFVGDVGGSIVSGIVNTGKTIANGIVDGVKTVWSWITS